MLLQITDKRPQYYFYAIILCHPSEKCHFKHTLTDPGVWLSCYPHISAILISLTTINQCLTIFLPKNYLSQRITHFFNKWLYIHHKFFIEKWVNRRHFFIDEKNLQKLRLTAELISVYSYNITIPSFQS